MTDPTPTPTPPVPESDDVEVDVRAFLPEGVVLERDDVDDRPEPEVPAWALDDAPRTTAAPAASEEPIDVTALEAAEVAVAEVEDALSAIDAGELERSPLLVRLLAG